MLPNEEVSFVKLRVAKISDTERFRKNSTARGPWANGSINQWTNGPMDKKLLQPYEKKNTLEHWIIGPLEHSTFNQHQFASCDKNCIDTI